MHRLSSLRYIAKFFISKLLSEIQLWKQYAQRSLGATFFSRDRDEQRWAIYQRYRSQRVPATTVDKLKSPPISTNFQNWVLSRDSCRFIGIPIYSCEY